MKLNIIIVLILAAFISLPAQAQKSKGKKNSKKEFVGNKGEQLKNNNANKQKQEIKNAKDKGKEKINKIKEEKEQTRTHNDNHKGNDHDDDGSFSKDDDGYSKEDRDRDKKKKNKEKSNNGNAYGKHKYGLEGREFGQERARQAKLKNKETNEQLTETVIIAESKLPTLKERIGKAKDILSEQKPQLSTEVFNEKSTKLQEAIEKMSRLEKLVKEAKSIKE